MKIDFLLFITKSYWLTPKRPNQETGSISFQIGFQLREILSFSLNAFFLNTHYWHCRSHDFLLSYFLLFYFFSFINWLLIFCMLLPKESFYNFFQGDPTYFFHFRTNHFDQLSRTISLLCIAMWCGNIKGYARKMIWLNYKI